MQDFHFTVHRAGSTNHSDAQQESGEIQEFGAPTFLLVEKQKTKNIFLLMILKFHYPFG
jgi:hypothetical protein